MIYYMVLSKKKITHSSVAFNYRRHFERKGKPIEGVGHNYIKSNGAKYALNTPKAVTISGGGYVMRSIN